jgi:hypothetical protein
MHFEDFMADPPVLLKGFIGWRVQNFSAMANIRGI